MGRIVPKSCLALLVTFATTSFAGADEVRLISVGGVKDALDPIIAEFTKATGHEVIYAVGSPLIVSKRLASGEAFDVIVQSAPAMDDVAKANGLRADTRKPVARGGIGLAVHANAAAPDISTPDAFRKALLAAKSIGVGDPAMPNGSGIIILKIFSTSGIHDQLRDRIKVVGLDPGQKMIASGELELGLMNSSEVRSYLKFVGQVPPPLQGYTLYDIAVMAKAASPAAASALAQVILSRDAVKHWTAARMEPRGALGGG